MVSAQQVPRVSNEVICFALRSAPVIADQICYPFYASLGPVLQYREAILMSRVTYLFIMLNGYCRCEVLLTSRGNSRDQ